MGMNRYFKLVCIHEDPEWYLREFLSGRARYGWSGRGCDLREIKKMEWATWTDVQRVAWSYSKFLAERIAVGHRIVIQMERPIRRFLIAEVVSPGYEFTPGDLDDFNHVLHVRPLTSKPIPINSKETTAALKHDLSKRGNYYEIYPEESIHELDALVEKISKGDIDLTAVRTDEDTLDATLRDIKTRTIREIHRKWPGKDFERFCAMLLHKIDYIEVKDLTDRGRGWDMLIRIINPLTQTILHDDVPVQCKNYEGGVDDFGPIDDLERCLENSDSPVAYLMILGQLSPKFMAELQIRQDALQKKRDRPTTFEIVSEDRIAEIYSAFVMSGLSQQRMIT